MTMATDTVGFDFVLGLFRQIDVFIQHMCVMLVCGIDVWGFWTVMVSRSSTDAGGVEHSQSNIITTQAERRCI